MWNNQVQLTLKQIVESYNLMCSTNDPETFFSRCNYGCGKIEQLKKYEQAGLYEHTCDSKYYKDLYNKNAYAAFYHCYKRYMEKARKELKTEKAIEKRKDKFWETSETYLGNAGIKELQIRMNKV